MSTIQSTPVNFIETEALFAQKSQLQVSGARSITNLKY